IILRLYIPPPWWSGLPLPPCVWCDPALADQVGGLLLHGLYCREQCCRPTSSGFPITSPGSAIFTVQFGPSLSQHVPVAFHSALSWYRDSALSTVRHRHHHQAHASL